MAIDFPDSPSNNDIYTVNGKRWIYSNGKWSIYGSTSPDATASDTEPTGVGDGHIWYRSDQSQTLIRYDNTWVEVGSAGGFDNASTSFPTSLDSATGFAAVEALQAKVGVNSSGVATSHDYKIADHASRLTTLEGQGEYVDYSGSITFTNLTLGNGTINYAHYARIGDFVHFAGQVTLGSTSLVTGNVGGSLPVNANTRERGAGNCEFIDNGVGAYGGAAHANGASLGIYCLEETSGYVKNQTVIANRPFEWATGDSISWTIVYRAA